MTLETGAAHCKVRIAVPSKVRALYSTPDRVWPSLRARCVICCAAHRCNSFSGEGDERARLDVRILHKVVAAAGAPDIGLHRERAKAAPPQALQHAQHDGRARHGAVRVEVVLHLRARLSTLSGPAARPA